MSENTYDIVDMAEDVAKYGYALSKGVLQTLQTRLFSYP